MKLEDWEQKFQASEGVPNEGDGYSRYVLIINGDPVTELLLKPTDKLHLARMGDVEKLEL